MDFKDLIDFSDNPKQDKKLREAKEKEDELMEQEINESLGEGDEWTRRL